MSSDFKNAINQILLALLYISVAFLLGYWVLIPVISVAITHEYVTAVLSGMVVIFLGYLAVRAIHIHNYNLWMIYDKPVNLPTKADEIKQLGVRNPVDFCLLMATVFATTTVNIAGWDPYTMCESQNDDAWLDAAELFKSTFGQNLHGYVPIDSGMHSWSECLSDEARILLGRKQEDDISTSEIWELISAETKKQLRVVISEVGEE